MDRAVHLCDALYWDRYVTRKWDWNLANHNTQSGCSVNSTLPPIRLSLCRQSHECFAYHSEGQWLQGSLRHTHAGSYTDARWYERRALCTDVVINLKENVYIYTVCRGRNAIGRIGAGFDPDHGCCSVSHTTLQLGC